MKSVADLILELQHATAPDRKMDIELGEIAGYRKLVKNDANEGKKKVVWLFQTDGSESSSLPRFTATTDAAQELAKMLIPGCIGGFTWRPGRATARIDDGPIFTAFTPAIAICAAALSAKYFTNANTEDVSG